MTKIDPIRDVLDEMKTLADKATPGPWEVNTPKGYKVSGLWSPDGEIANDNEGVWFSTEDAAFIAAARTYLPRLIVAVVGVLSVEGDDCPLGSTEAHEAWRDALNTVHQIATAALTRGESDE